MSKHYYKRKELGLCPYCGKNKPIEGQTLCIECKEHKKKKYRDLQNTTYHKRKAQGLCVNCGGTPEDGKVLCVYCKNLNFIKKEEKKKHLLHQGKCIICGTKKTFRDTFEDGSFKDRCHKCLEKQRIRVKKSQFKKYQKEEKNNDTFNLL